MTEVNKYNHSKIYKICSNKTDKIYIGSTTQILAKRLYEHVLNYKQYLKTNTKYISSIEIIKLEDYYIVLIEECNFNNKEQLLKREGEIIKLNINNVINNRIAGRTHKEYQNDNKEHIAEQKKQYRQDNKEHLTEQKIQYRQDNKEHIAECQKKYYNDNKENILEKMKQYQNDNKEHRLEKMKQYYNDNKTKKHINITNNLLILNELTFFNL